MCWVADEVRCVQSFYEDRSRSKSSKCPVFSAIEKSRGQDLRTPVREQKQRVCSKSDDIPKRKYWSELPLPVLFPYERPVHMFCETMPFSTDRLHVHTADGESSVLNAKAPSSCHDFHIQGLNPDSNAVHNKSPSPEAYITNLLGESNPRSFVVFNQSFHSTRPCPFPPSSPNTSSNSILFFGL